MQYANINDAQAAMTSDQYVGLNADGTYGLFDRAQNPQWVRANTRTRWRACRSRTACTESA